MGELVVEGAKKMEDVFELVLEVVALDLAEFVLLESIGDIGRFIPFIIALRRLFLALLFCVLFNLDWVFLFCAAFFNLLMLRWVEAFNAALYAVFPIFIVF